jgi:hypothetical protein
VQDAAEELEEEGLLENEDLNRIDDYLAYGSGWPFHQHHMHFSWEWEDAYEGRTQHRLEGCQIEPTTIGGQTSPR